MDSGILAFEKNPLTEGVTIAPRAIVQIIWPLHAG